MNMLDVIGKLNWLDIFAVILLFRICYIAAKSGLPIELFKLLGTGFATYLSMHYYSRLSDFIGAAIGFVKIQPMIFDFVSFIVLAVLGYFIFILLRSIFYRLMKMEAAPLLNKWGGFALGILRGILLASIIIFIFVISPVDYLKKSVDNSFSGKSLIKVAPAAYSGLWYGIVSKFIRNDKFNEAVTKVESLDYKK